MTHVYFHCSNPKKVFVDRRGPVTGDLAEARKHATRVVQSFTNEVSLEDWRDWVMHVGFRAEVVISRAVVEGTAHPLYIYADRADRAVESSAMVY
jgi:hypothetical protein